MFGASPPSASTETSLGSCWDCGRPSAALSTKIWVAKAPSLRRKVKAVFLFIGSVFVAGGFWDCVTKLIHLTHPLPLRFGEVPKLGRFNLSELEFISCKKCLSALLEVVNRQWKFHSIFFSQSEYKWKRKKKKSQPLKHWTLGMGMCWLSLGKEQRYWTFGQGTFYSWKRRDRCPFHECKWSWPRCQQ